MSGSRAAPLPVAKCLGDAVDQGRLTRAQAEEALALVKKFMRENGLPPDQAAAAAAQRLQADAARKQRQAAIQVLRTKEAIDNARSHPRDFAAGVAALFARDLTGKATYSNVEGRTRAIRGLAHARLADFLDRFRTKRLGLTRDDAGLRQFVRALYGEATPDAEAGALARAWTETTDGLVDRFSQAGGALGKREGWRLPQAWDGDRVKAAGRDAFERYMHEAAEAGRLRITDWETGEPVDPIKRSLIITEAWERISTNGMSDLTPGAGGRGSVANSRNTRRAFEWTSADAWFDFNDRYGLGEAALYDMLIGHIDGLARHIAMMEILGPNAGHLARVLIDTARKEGHGTYLLGAIWDHASGAANAPHNEGFAGFMRGVRSFLTSVQLGSATVSSVTDFSTLRATAAWNGLDASRMMSRYVSQLRDMSIAGDGEAGRLAVRHGLIAEGWAQRAAGAMRNQAEVIGTDFGARAADFVLRASGLNAHTQAGRWAFGMEFLGTLADNAVKPLDQLDDTLRRAFAGYGISAADWDVIRTRGLVDEDGLRIIHPERIVTGGDGAAPPADPAAAAAEAARHRTVASRLLEMIQTETGFAIVEPGAAERALLLGRSRPGDLAGELLRSSTQYKSFPVSMMTRHVMRGLNSYRAGDRGKYMVATAVSLTLMGGLAMQLKALSQGRDPRDMSDPNFWGAAFMQGGGAGIFGDFLFAGVNRSDRSFYLNILGGPTAGLVDDLARLTGGNIQGIAQAKDTHFGAELARFVQRNTPGTSLWYARLALDRLMWERLHELADDDRPRRIARMERRALDEFGQRFWWRPGDRAPERAPSAGAAAGFDPTAAGATP